MTHTNHEPLPPESPSGSPRPDSGKRNALPGSPNTTLRI